METRIKSVQIYRSGAAVERRGSMTLQKGLNKVSISGLSNSADTASLRLFFPEGVSGNNIRTLNPAFDDQEEEKPSAAVAEKISLVEQEKEILNEQIRLWKENGTFTGEGCDVGQIEAYIEKLPERVMNVNRRLNALAKEKKELEKQLNEMLEQERKPLVTADLYAEAEGTYPFSLKYYDNGASWHPVYEIHTEGKGSELEFRVRAALVQNTGEDWEDINVSLYTGNPSRSNDLPVLNPVYLNIRPEIQMRASAPMGGAGVFAKLTESYLAGEEADADMAMEETVQMKRIETPQAEVSDSETMTEYILNEPRTVICGNDGTIVDLQTFRLSAEYELIAVPKLQNNAFLCANVKTADLPVMVGGNAGVYLSDAYIGEVMISPDMSEENFRISLGKDDRIQVQRKEARRKNATTLLKSQNTREQEYEIQITNRKAEDVQLTVHDQIPVSQDKTISVDNVKTDNGSLDEKTGEVIWKLTVPSQKTETVHLGWRVAWPKDKELQETRPYVSRRFCPECGSPMNGNTCPVCNYGIPTFLRGR